MEKRDTNEGRHDERRGREVALRDKKGHCPSPTVCPAILPLLHTSSASPSRRIKKELTVVEARRIAQVSAPCIAWEQGREGRMNNKEDTQKKQTSSDEMSGVRMSVPWQRILKLQPPFQQRLHSSLCVQCLDKWRKNLTRAKLIPAFLMQVLQTPIAWECPRLRVINNTCILPKIR